jgi:UDP-N-acetylmuramoyl-L-alanyl-D-glutamate--2,6-diaminopimelate ligase
MFAAAAAAAGAVAVMTDPAGAAIIGDALSAAVLTVTDPRAVLGDVAAAIYGDPTRHLSLLGVTGTNGKTTVAYLLEAGLAAAGHRTGLIGTVQTRIADAVVPSVRTTPEAPELQALFATMRERGVDAAAMEVSSHALALHRVDGCHFAGAAFTNLSQDHLDFHDTIEDYFEAKASLFDAQHGFVPPGRAVICVDDEYGRRLARRHPDAVTFGFGADADWRAVDVRCGPVGSRRVPTSPSGPTSRCRGRSTSATHSVPSLCSPRPAPRSRRHWTESGGWSAYRVAWSGSTRGSPSSPWSTTRTPRQR